ncbi:MAG: right-handed parallel beta-helix repeat-containing protein [bacterium]
MERFLKLALNWILGLMIAAVIVLLQVPRAVAEEIHVPGDYTKIQSAINAADDGDEIIVAPGTYREYINFVSKAITVRSTNPDDLETVKTTIIDAGGTSPAVTFWGGGNGAALKGITVTNGFNQYSGGGGIVCMNKASGQGAGPASPTIANCIITGNICGATSGGGGICCGRNCSPTIDNCIISMNKALNGYGGGIDCFSNASPLISRCTFFANEARHGGGISSRSSSRPQIINCVINENTAHGNGGGIYALQSTQTKVINCTLYGNSASAPHNGGGIYCDSATVTNCIIYNNNNGEIDGIGSTMTVTYSVIKGGSYGMLDADPLFVDPVSGDFHLQDGSPCIDAGTTLGAPDDDKDGIVRPQDGDSDGSALPDIGAYEYKINTLVSLGRFSADVQEKNVIITWTTLSEIDTAGFNLWRAQEESGEYTRINPAPIGAYGGPTMNAEYSYIDDTASPSNRYYYQLEEVDGRGMSTFYGPVSPATPSNMPGERCPGDSGSLEYPQYLLWLNLIHYPPCYFSLWYSIPEWYLWM